MTRQCSIEDCGTRHYARRYCKPHYLRLLRSGDPTTAPSRMVDVIAVDRAVAGQYAGRLTIAEKEAALTRLDRAGVPSREIAVRLGLKDGNSVCAMRCRMRRRAQAQASTLGVAA